jgi:hypothetical protein
MRQACRQSSAARTCGTKATSAGLCCTGRSTIRGVSTALIAQAQASTRESSTLRRMNMPRCMNDCGNCTYPWVQIHTSMCADTYIQTTHVMSGFAFTASKMCNKHIHAHTQLPLKAKRGAPEHKYTHIHTHTLNHAHACSTAGAPDGDGQFSKRRPLRNETRQRFRWHGSDARTFHRARVWLAIRLPLLPKGFEPPDPHTRQGQVRLLCTCIRARFASLTLSICPAFLRRAYAGFLRTLISIRLTFF